MITGTTATSRGARRAGSPGRWSAYAACVLALLYASVSFYWAAGGTTGLSTIGGELERMARARDPGLVAVVLVTAFLKVAYGLLALALVRPFGRALPRWALLWAAWAGAGLLSAYGGLLVAAQALVAVGFVGVGEPADRRALLWHLFVWDPWFLAMGLLLGVAVWQYQRGTRRRR